MLVVFLVAAVGVRVGELRVACFLCVAVVADRQVGSCPEGGPEVDRVEDGALFVDEAHFLFEREREEEGLAPHVRVQRVGSRAPGYGREPSDDLAELCFDQDYGVGLAVTSLVKVFD